jgi:hypothetical protein
MACSEGQLSLESDAWKNGQFTYYFVDEGIKQGLAHKDELNGATVEKAFDHAKENCIVQTPVASDGFANNVLP